MLNRRGFIRAGGVAGGLAALGARGGADPGPAPWLLTEEDFSPAQEDLYEVIRGIPVDDTHTHPMTFQDVFLDPGAFLERLALSSFPMANYFPAGVYGRWLEARAEERAALDREHGITRIRDDVLRHARETVFLKGMVKELARFLGCEASLEGVVEARSAVAGRDYGAYMARLFREAGIQNAMLDMGYREGLDQAGVERFEEAINPTRGRRILRVDTLQVELWRESQDADFAFDELEARFDVRLVEGLDGTGNLGGRSYGMKSYLLPRLGLLKPHYDRAAAARSWDSFRAARADGILPAGDGVDRDEHWKIQEDVLLYLHTRALEACLDRDMPMQFHAGDGEAPRGIMRNQDPFLMEEMIRLERDGRMRYPKVILIHAGYPLVGRAAWICHLYGNAYFELSLVTPLIHQGLVRMYLEVMESVPLTKILFGSDAYHLPEFNWLAAVWGRRFLARALGTYVEGGLLGRDEALEAARRILHQNNRDVYGLSD